MLIFAFSTLLPAIDLLETVSENIAHPQGVLIKVVPKPVVDDCFLRHLICQEHLIVKFSRTLEDPCGAMF